jgi:hypothetical protein
MFPVSFTLVPANEIDRPLGIIFVNVRRESPFLSCSYMPNCRHECEAITYVDITVVYIFSDS